MAFADFRADPDKHPLTTPTGKIEIFSSTIDGYGYPDCPGHPPSPRTGRAHLSTVGDG